MVKIRSTRQKVVIVCVLLLVLYLIFYLVADRITPNTDDSYFEAHTIQIAPRVSGRVVAVDVKNNAKVTKGQLLFVLNDKVYVHALKQAKALLDEANGEVASIKAQADSAKADIKRASADLAFVRKRYLAMQQLAKENAIAKLKFQAVADQYHKAQQALASARGAWLALEVQLTQDHGQYAQVAKAEANYQQALQNVANTKVYAPFDGRVTFLRMSRGAYIKAGDPVLALIDMRHMWVIARIKENNLSDIKKGQSVDISPEMYPNVTLKGSVSSIGWGVNLLDQIPPVWMPHIPATRNWVRLAARFPVEISIDRNPNYPLRVGGSASVTIYTERSGLIYGLSKLRQRIEAFLQFVY